MTLSRRFEVSMTITLDGSVSAHLLESAILRALASSEFGLNGIAHVTAKPVVDEGPRTALGSGVVAVPVIDEGPRPLSPPHSQWPVGSVVEKP
jgi:hypothetical protein